MCFVRTRTRIQSRTRTRTRAQFQCPSCIFSTYISGCGKTSIQGKRIIAGETAVRGSWPWQILIINNGKAICGGTLIASQWVVTAAHCVYGQKTVPWVR